MNDNQKRLPMAEQIRRAGDQAVPMLVGIHFRAGVEAMAALHALGRADEDGGPDPAQAKEHIGRVLRLLLAGDA